MSKGDGYFVSNPSVAAVAVKASTVKNDDGEREGELPESEGFALWRGNLLEEQQPGSCATLDIEGGYAIGPR